MGVSNEERAHALELAKAAIGTRTKATIQKKFTLRPEDLEMFEILKKLNGIDSDVELFRKLVAKEILDGRTINEQLDERLKRT